MDKITEDSLQTDRELPSPPSLKRPRTHCTVINDHSGESRFDFPERLTFWKTCGPPSSKGIQQKNVVLIYTAENNDSKYEKHHKQPQDNKLIVTPITEVAISCCDDADRGLSKVCVITTERQLPDLEKDEHSPVSQSDKICSYPLDDAGGVLAGSHTSEDTSTDMFSHSDCKRLEKSLEDEAPGEDRLSTGNDKDGRQVQHGVIQIQASGLNLSSEEVRCQCDAYETMLHDVSFCNTCSQSDEAEVSNHKRDEQRFKENIIFSREEEDEGYSPTSSNNIPDCKSFHSYPEEDLSGNVAEDVENEEKLLQLQICENKYFAVCDRETKGPVNENSNSFLYIAECAEGSLVSYDVALARNTANENVSLETDDLCGAKREHAAGKMIAKAWTVTADHTTETPVSAQISQEPAEGDDNVGLFSVTDPADWNETDKEAEEKRCKSASIASVGLSPSIKVCFDVRLSQEVSAPKKTRQCYHQSTTEQCKDEEEDLCQSYVEPDTSIITNEMHNMTAVESSSPHRLANPVPALDAFGSYRTVGLELKEQDQSDFFPISPDNLRTREAEHSQAEIARMDRTTEIKEREEIIRFEELKTEHLNLENEVELEEHLQQNELDKEDTTEISTGDCISDGTEGDICDCGGNVTCVKLENEFECFSDHIYSADISMMTNSLQKEGKEVTYMGEKVKTKGHENSEIVVKSEDDLQEQNEHKTHTTEVSHVQYISDWTVGNISTGGNKLTLVSQNEQGNKLGSCSGYQHRVEPCMVENTDDLMAFTSLPTSDVVVPCSSETANNNLPALNCSVKFSPVPSAFAFCNWMPGGLDTFEKIQLSPDDDLGSSPVLISLPQQVSKTPQRQLSYCMPGTESDRYDQTPEEEEEEAKEEGDMEKTECHTDYMAITTSSADVIALGWPEQQPNCESTCDSCEPIQGGSDTLSKSRVSTESHSPPSDVKSFPEFEKKKQFDMVVKELNLFFDISKSDFTSNRAPSHECCDITEPSEAKKEHFSSTDLGSHRHTSTDDGDDRSLEMCSGDPVVSRNTGRGDGEQEVPLGSPMCPKKSMYTAEKHRETWEMEQRKKTWSPSFMCLPLLEQLSHRLPEPPKRLEPLRTCIRPIRVGLSRRAKTKHLHRPHPYK